jgi:hypothetical protein
MSSELFSQEVYIKEAVKYLFFENEAPLRKNTIFSIQNTECSRKNVNCMSSDI